MSRLANSLPLEEALAINNWYSPDLKVNAFIGAEGRLVVIINNAPQYLYPSVPEEPA